MECDLLEMPVSLSELTQAGRNQPDESCTWCSGC